jgi:3-dehydrosphinganine reductase
MINCAGFAAYGRFEDQPIESLEDCMQINYMGSVYALQQAWPFLKKAKGQLSFVSNVAGYLGLIGYSSYSPTKLAMTGLAESLRFEEVDDNIRSLSFIPLIPILQCCGIGTFILYRSA